MNNQDVLQNNNKMNRCTFQIFQGKLAQLKKVLLREM